MRPGHRMGHSSTGRNPVMVHIYHEFLRDFHSANGKRYAQSCTPLAGSTAGAYDADLFATLSQIEVAFDK